MGNDEDKYKQQKRHRDKSNNWKDSLKKSTQE